ncbi:PTS sugar transporter subunit IIA [uncultured Lactobacillus sp.]|uniref:PTS sugar transporter subunit IIA n=1 Tax=uncultured Lactobacillus sp. TaxID=153152 RepID=UPI002614F07A|nr:PTS sugar transporter subunit IIA [uncultured Lactobacillus sp.]
MELLIATHEGLATGLMAAHDMLAGKNDQILTIELNDSGIRDFKARFAKIMNKYQSSQILVLTDLKNGTPHLVASEYEDMYPERVRVVSGVNLPMVLELSHKMINANLDPSAQKAIEVGRSQIDVDQVVQAK